MKYINCEPITSVNYIFRVKNAVDNTQFVYCYVWGTTATLCIKNIRKVNISKLPTIKDDNKAQINLETKYLHAKMILCFVGLGRIFGLFSIHYSRFVCLYFVVNVSKYKLFITNFTSKMYVKIANKWIYLLHSRKHNRLNCVPFNI